MFYTFWSLCVFGIYQFLHFVVLIWGKRSGFRFVSLWFYVIDVHSSSLSLSRYMQFKQETESKKRKNSLESDMTNVQMNGFDEKMRSSSVTSTCSEPAIRGSVMLKRQQSTPTITTLTSPKDMKLKPRKKLKRRKSFGLGLK